MFSMVNNVKVSETEAATIIELELTWSGSWKNDINCDGVYVFAKYRRKNDDAYTSVMLSRASEGEFCCLCTAPSGFELSDSTVGMYVPSTRLGMFFFPCDECADKAQEFTAKIICDKIPEYDDIKFFAIEMVYIPEAPHYVGDPENGISKGGKLKNCLYKYPDKGAYLIDSEKPIRLAAEEDCLYCDADTPNGRQEEIPFVIPEKFPKGYRAMWYMKYSLNNAQFTQFLNCLTREQQKTHVMSDISGDYIENYYVMTDTSEEVDRSAIYCRRSNNTADKPVIFFTYAPMRACNAIAYRDVAAFACFSGLRLITELEYEKAARGTLDAVAGEFAWGSVNIGRVFNFSGVDGSGAEIPVAEADNRIVNCNFGEGIAPFERNIKTVPDNPGWIGPVSTGLFERSPLLEGFSKRECTGASFYGVMELSGNVWENVVSIGREEGRGYDGSHGNGRLDANGNHTMEAWPDSETATGIGVRGGVFVSPTPEYVRMALRVFAAHTKSEKRYHGGLRVGF